MNCAEAHDRMEDVALGLVPTSEMGPFLEHVAACGTCSEELERRTEGRTGCACAHDDVQRDLMLTELGRTWQRGRLRTAGICLAAALALLVLGLLFA